MKTIASSDELIILGLGIKIAKPKTGNPNRGASSISIISMNSSPEKLDDFSQNRS